jgi:hypothetical protein
MKRVLSAVLALVLAFCSFGSQAATIRPPKGFEGRMWNSTLALYGTLGDTTHFLCTTEVIGKIPGGYRLLSAGHCVQLPPPGLQFSVADDTGSPRTDVVMVKAYMKADLDMAIFDLKTTKKYDVMELGTDDDLQVGDEVINPNFAAGLGKQLSHGVISSGILPLSDHCDEDCATDFLIQSFGSGGASGSAVISTKTHKIIGIAIWQAQGANVGIGVEPISKFAAFMAGPNQPHPIPEDADESDIP